MENFWNKVDKAGDCWLWQASKTHNGYGQFFAGLECRAHRVSWVLHNGPIPEGMLVLHTCDVRHCVNPSHLFLGNGRDNTRDMIKKGRMCVGSRHKRAKLTEKDVIHIREARERGGASY